METICCAHCGHEYDRHIGDLCPNCGHDNHDTEITDAKDEEAANA